MSVKIGVNGMGRIGKQALRAVFESPKLANDIEIVSVNDVDDIESVKYRILHDSTHGYFNKEVRLDGGDFLIDGKRIRFQSSRDPKNLDWSGVDVLLEATGVFLTRELAEAHLQAGAKKVVMSAPAKDETPTFVLGVNENEYRPETSIVSNASCTTNCLAPIVKVLEDALGIEEGFMATIHAATLSQNVLDGKSKKLLREGRATLNNIIPTTTGATKSVVKVVPSCKGKLTGISYRVPTMNVSMVDFTVRLKRPTHLSEIGALLRDASENSMKGILSYSEDALVSSDINHNPHSCVYDATASLALGDRFFKLIAWYDNEWAYANRLVEMAAYIAKK